MKAITLIALVILTSVTIHYWAALVAAAPASESSQSVPSGEDAGADVKKSGGSAGGLIELLKFQILTNLPSSRARLCCRHHQLLFVFTHASRRRLKHTLHCRR